MNIEIKENEVPLSPEEEFTVKALLVLEVKPEPINVLLYMLFFLVAIITFHQFLDHNS